MSSGYCAVSNEFHDSIDIHHIIPREYGGECGPTISLSPTIHQTLHRLAFKPDKMEAFANRYPNRTLLLDLARCIRESKEKFLKIPSNKVTVQFSNEEMQILSHNAEIMGITVSSLVSAIVKKVINGVQNSSLKEEA